MMDLRIEGANRLEHLGRTLKQVADKDLQKALYKAMNRTGGPLRDEAVAAALYVLPKRGGLAASIVKRDFVIKVRISGRNVGVQIRSTRKHDVARWNKGVIRRPVFADPAKLRSEWVWVDQKFAEPGWLDTALNRVAPQVRPEVIRALDELAAELDVKLRH
jgi:hypothetical protein